MGAPTAGRITALLTDLRAESDELDALVADLDADGWRTATPAVGWTIAHQIGHLTWTDEITVVAVTDPERFERERAESSDLTAAVDAGAESLAGLPHGELLDRWRASRAAVLHALAAVQQDSRIVWFGPPMAAPSMATARLMETWAHGQDVADALGVRRRPTGRLRHVAHLGVRTRDFAFTINGRTPPARPFLVELTGPGGELWTFGPADAAQRVVGSAEDFALVATQRRDVAQTRLRAIGRDAVAWLEIAQAFAGPPGRRRDAPDT